MLERLKEIVLDLAARLDLQPTYGWAVVTSLTPLQIRYDAQAEAIAGTPDTLVSGLGIGDRVWCMRIFRRDLILGRAKGAQNKVLWSGAAFMHGSQTQYLSELVSEQETGIILVWQAYTNGASQPRDINYTFIPKWHSVGLDSRGVSCSIHPDMSNTSSYQKYVYVFDDRVSGFTGNETAPRNSHVLTKVLGV